MLALFYDTETTGLPIWGQPSDDPDQPHIVQLAAHLVDTDQRKVIQSIDLIAKPSGWEIPEATTAIHGISTEYALKVGVPEGLIVETLALLWKQCELRIAHNESFDARIVRIALQRINLHDFSDEWKAGQAECTCSMATKVMCMPASEKMRAKGRRNHKKPKLSEAYEFFCDQKLKGAHNAMTDVNACMRIWFKMKETGL